MELAKRFNSQERLARLVRLGIFAITLSVVVAACLGVFGWGDAIGVLVGSWILLSSAFPLVGTEAGQKAFNELVTSAKFIGIVVGIVLLIILPFALTNVGHTPGPDEKYLAFINALLLGASLLFLLILSRSEDEPSASPPGVLACGCAHQCDQAQAPETKDDLQEPPVPEGTPADS